MRFARHQQHTDHEGLPITSLIDVVFLLLIFFMVTSALAPSESQLPSALRSETRSPQSLADFQPQIVTVAHRDGRDVFIIGQRQLHSKTALATLLAQLPKDWGVFIKGQPDARVDAVAAALQAARDAGFSRITYVPAR